MAARRSVVDAPAVPGGPAAWVSAVAETQLRQILVPGDALAVVRQLLGGLAGRSSLLHGALHYRAAVDGASAQLGLRDRVSAVDRLGPVMPGQRTQAGGRTLTTLFTVALLHAALDDLRPTMRNPLKAEHSSMGRILADLDDLCALLTQDACCLRIGSALAPTWPATLPEFTATLRHLS